jgi:hypothetical protein
MYITQYRLRCRLNQIAFHPLICIFQPGDKTNYNSRYLQEAPTQMISKGYCKSFFVDDKMKEAIEDYMICTMGPGNIDAEGYVIDQGNFKFKDGCVRRQLEPDGKVSW